MGSGNPFLRLTQINVATLIDVPVGSPDHLHGDHPPASLGLDGRIPNVATKGGSSEQPIIVVFTRDKTINLQSKIVSKTELAIRLTDILRPRMDRNVFLETDPEITFEAVAEVMDIIHNAGAESVGLITRVQIHGTTLSTDH